MSSDEEEVFEPTVQNLIDQDTLRWIFVGGKGGVGKTTTSCSLGVLFSTAKPDKKVLIVSTDPAHNLSDAFCQKFTHEPQPVNTFNNLFCMEIEPKSLQEEFSLGEDSDQPNPFGGLLKDIGGNIPGIDETMSFLQIMRSVQEMEYDIIIFDTAPTGHTLHLLKFPSTIEVALDKVISLKNRFGGLLGNVANMFMGGSASGQGNIIEVMSQKLVEMKTSIVQVNKYFQDPNFTTFVCVCIPEFLSVYETERLVQELTKYGIDAHNLVVNQVLFAEKDSCRKLLARKKMQDKYLRNIYELYGEDFNISVLPITDEEVRGAEKLRSFSKNYLKPYEPEEIVGINAIPGSKEEIVDKICSKFDLDKSLVEEYLLS
eukprot:maker-scaffold_10-snap-gene-0.22-mRNA-1 protein AED:0.01 eAED:0.01 QI:323/1/1/1/1/1/2/113/371